MRKGVDTHALLTLFATLLAVALPLQILVAGTSIAHPDPEQFAELHRQDGFWLRATLTFLYFPAAIVLHLLVQAAAERRRTAFLAGFYLFLLGNGIDLLFRSIQFLVAHGVWAAQLLEAVAPAERAAARAKLVAFDEIAAAFGFAFSLLFAFGRSLMGSALLAAPTVWARLAGMGLVATGAFNAIFALTAVPSFAFIAQAAPLYPWVWLAGLVALGIAAWHADRN